MGKRTFSSDAFLGVKAKATKGGTASATHAAEERIRRGEGMDPMVDPKGLAHLGPVRMSKPRFERREDGLWVLTCGVPMAEETLLDTTGSMGNNVELAFASLPKAYEMLSVILKGYDVQIATGIFNDVQDGVPVFYRSQFEMAEKIAEQMTLLAPGKKGGGNGKEDPQFGLFGAAYLTAATINKYGLKSYHFTISDEPIVETIDQRWLREIFGDDVLERVKENGHVLDLKNFPDTAKVVADLQTRAHAFFLQVDNRPDVTEQWSDLYGPDHLVMLPDGTEYLHCVKAVIIGLTEGVLDLGSAKDFLIKHDVPAGIAGRIVRAVAHIPLAAQAALPNFNKLPKAGDVFREKTDLWPISEEELANVTSVDAQASTGGPVWL